MRKEQGRDEFKKAQADTRIPNLKKKRPLSNTAVPFKRM